MFDKTITDDPPQENGHKDADRPHPIEDVCASSVETKPVEWLWVGRIPKTKLTMFDGDPDLGKSVVTMDIAARVSVGRTFPDDAPCEAGNVLIVNVEDGVDDTIVPRLKAHGADLERVFIFSSVSDGKGSKRLLELPQDIALLKSKVKERDAKLLIIDPVLTMLGGDVNKDQDARKALAPLRDMAEGTGVAVICVRHLNKNVSLSAIQRGGGNMGLIGVARAGSFFARHPDEDGLRVMASHKSNLAQRPPSLAYRIVTSTVQDTARIEWKGVTDHDADNLAAGGVSPHEKTVLDEAIQFLRDELNDRPVMAKTVFKDAHDAGIAEITLRRAKTALRVRSERQGTDGWAWRLPDEDAHGHGVDNVDLLEHLPHIGDGVSEYSPYVKGDDHDDQDDHAERDDHERDQLPQRHSPDEPEALIGAVNEERFVAATPPANVALSAEIDVESVQPENDACRVDDDDTIRAEREVFDMWPERGHRAGAS
jgi:hypothetical protein